MIRLTVLYSKAAGSQFDLTYYLDKHIPLVKERLMTFGLVGVDIQEALTGGAGPPPLYTIPVWRLTQLMNSTGE